MIDASTNNALARESKPIAASACRTWRDLVSREQLLVAGACPMTAAATDDTLIVWCATDDGVALAHELAFALGCRLHTETRDRQEVTAEIERLFARSPASPDDASSRSAGAIDDPHELARQAPVVRFVSLLLREAIRCGASDVHLDTSPQGLVVRLRRDGVLVGGPEAHGIPAAAALSRLKLLADLDIAERRRPQDGSMRARIGDADVDLRVATAPTIHGESMVVRVLDSREGLLPLESLGMPDAVLRGFRRALGTREGLLLVTGPTGSGKTTTLYAALMTRANGTEKILSVEDPVEIQLAGVTQVPVHRETGVSFACALRSLLRHDPDVLLVGELRDAETAQVAVQAAMTGHLVLATLHTNDAPSAISRLVDLGVPRFLVAETLLGVLAQRLVRRVCERCRGTLLGSATGSCARCRDTGLAGRIGVFEYLPLTPEIAAAVNAGEDRATLLSCARAAGWTPLATDADAKVESGQTTRHEVSRALGL